jgi:hypothetical protein
MKIQNKGTRINFYDLAGKLNVSVEKLYSLYRGLFPTVKMYSYTNMLLEKEIEKLTEAVENIKREQNTDKVRISELLKYEN